MAQGQVSVATKLSVAIKLNHLVAWIPCCHLRLELGHACHRPALTPTRPLPCRYPTLHRPYRSPLPTWGCALLLLPAGSLLLGLLLAPVVQGDWHVVVFTLMALVAGFGLHPLLQHARHHGWCAFEGGTVHEFKERLYTMFAPPSTASLNAVDGEVLLR